jgi:GNAT superfamily N-acetyltransferase
VTTYSPASKRDDADAVYALIMEASAWLKRRGIAQWDPPFPRELFDQCIARGEVRLLRDEMGSLLGTINLAHSPPPYVPTVQASPQRWYLSRLVVSRARVGQGIGVTMLRLAEDEARAAGVGWLGLDCLTDNARLRRYYRDAGWRERGTARTFGADLTLFERVLASGGRTGESANIERA